MHRNRYGTPLALALAALALAAPAAGSASTREALPEAFGPAAASSLELDPIGKQRAMQRAIARRSARRSAAGAGEAAISTSHYGPGELASVAATLHALDHGPEIVRLAVFVATPEEIRSTCGEEVVACYFPAVREMVVSGVDRPVAGTPREFAIAHEYGHHISNESPAGLGSASGAGTLRWATYERVCQLTRRGRLFPGDQGAHYWQDPEEAFAQAYAYLNQPAMRLGWQYSLRLQPSAAALAKIHADVVNPWRGPVQRVWSGVVRPVSGASGSARAIARTQAGVAGIGSGHAVGGNPWLTSRRFATPLDGELTAKVRTSSGSGLLVSLRDPERGRVLARATTDAEGNARLSYENCGTSAVQLQIAALPGGPSPPRATPFEATVTRP